MLLRNNKVVDCTERHKNTIVKQPLSQADVKDEEPKNKRRRGEALHVAQREAAGTSASRESLTNDFRAADFISRSNILHLLPTKRVLHGVAVVRRELFLMGRDKTPLAVYNTDTFKLKRRLTVDGMKNPRCLAACQYFNCLYIGNCQPACILRVDLATSRVTQWPVDGEPAGLSVTRESHLLATMWYARKLIEYTTHGKPLREIKLDVVIDDPQHAVRLCNGLYVVSNARSEQNRVCVVDTAGRIVHSYGDAGGSSTAQVNYSRRLAVDSHDNVFVADCFNDRVALLSATLTRLGHVSTPGRTLAQPYCLHLDELNGRLYIGEYSGHVTALKASA